MRDWFSDDNKIPRTVGRVRREIETLVLRKVQAKGSATQKFSQPSLSYLRVKSPQDWGEASYESYYNIGHCRKLSVIHDLISFVKFTLRG